MLFPADYDLAQLVSDASTFTTEFSIIILGMAAFWGANRVLKIARKNMKG